MEQRKKQNNNIIYGIRPVMEAIAEGKDIDKILLQKGASSEIFKELFRTIREHDIPFQYVPAVRLDKYTRGNHQGVVCFTSTVVYQSIFDILPTLYEDGKVPFLLMLDKITDVRNMGAIARSAECAGVDAIIIPDKNTSQLNEDAVKTSAGALHKIPVCRHNSLIEVAEYLQQSGVVMEACTEKASDVYYQHSFDNPLCIVMGNEYEGISDDLLNMCQQKIKIPMVGTIESLNVSVAAGIVLFEVLRQRLPQVQKPL